MYVKKLASALVVGLIATTSLPALAADENTWTSIANQTMMKNNMKMMKEAMEMMSKAEKSKDIGMAKKAIEMMKQYIHDYETIFGGKAG